MANTNNAAPLAQKPAMIRGLGVPAGPAPVPGAPVVALSAVHATITKFQFRKLFTTAERMAIDNAQYNTALSGTQKAAIATMQKDLDSSGNVELGTPDVSFGIGYLVSVGLLTSARASRVLANLPPL